MAVYSLFLQQSGNIEGVITEERCYSSDIPQDGLEIPCTVRFSGDAKLGRYYKLGASKISILTEFILMQAPLTINSSNLILHQIFLLYGTNFRQQVQ